MIMRTQRNEFETHFIWVCGLDFGFQKKCEFLLRKKFLFIEKIQLLIIFIEKRAHLCLLFIHF
jgi:hypothetical protein